MERVAALWYDQTPYFPLEYIVWDPTLVRRRRCRPSAVAAEGTAEVRGD